MTLAAMELLASHGLLFVEDPATLYEGRQDLGDEPVTVLSPGHIVLTVRHPVDGPVSVRVLAEDAKPSLPVVYYEGEFVAAHGRLTVFDVPQDHRITVDAERGTFGLRILADAADEPARVEIVVERRD